MHHNALNVRVSGRLIYDAGTIQSGRLPHFLTSTVVVLFLRFAVATIDNIFHLHSAVARPFTFYYVKNVNAVTFIGTHHDICAQLMSDE